ncbi:MAG: iron-sulfur cluster repair di-iron protein [Crocinitomicaceae bacterium]|nr:iron-sulfur cluster repair di-iron protein [Crocinitomicaceae bacterium]
MNIESKQSIGEIVAGNYRAATVFKAHGIDFCCKGNRSIFEVCESNGIDESQLIHELYTHLNKINADSIGYQHWPLDLLADYIERKHHVYVEAKSIEIKEYLSKLCSVHGRAHPELILINDLFVAASKDLAVHMKKEELVLFPFVRRLQRAVDSGEQFQFSSFGGVENPIEVMKQDHDNEGERFRQIARLSNDYSVPEDGCNTYGVAYALLKEFEDDLHLHIHLENNILFPKVLEMEKVYLK